ncbi:sulfite exporter TauE/SafE [Candidatus Methanoplasma termitum]|uniref:Probable membrane transporter protein n=2 Tax=Candidatus Methanoplasma termitum TaxID=1577791 RepID=A0A0A7LAH8_9ARCH|nr:sulfite exporter TauE/SafE [Candidatus Methanoplasma termitum]
MLILALLAVGIGASIIGTIFGIGGGIIFIPILTVLLKLSANEAVAVSLVGIIATSTGAASYYVKQGASNVRLGLLLEITTTLGAMMGAFLAIYVANWILLCVFACVLIYSGATMILKKERVIADADDGSDMCFYYCDEKDPAEKRYKIINIKSGLAVCTGAGVLSSMTGVGGGTIKVPLMNVHMHVPIKVASPTSSYMIGITAFMGAIIYFIQGELLLDYAAAIAVGALIGSFIGTRVAKMIDAGPMRRYFSILLFAISIIIFLEAGGIL